MRALFLCIYSCTEILNPRSPATPGVLVQRKERLLASGGTGGGFTGWFQLHILLLGELMVRAFTASEISGRARHPACWMEGNLVTPFSLSLYGLLFWSEPADLQCLEDYSYQAFVTTMLLGKLVQVQDGLPRTGRLKSSKCTPRLIYWWMKHDSSTVKGGKLINKQNLKEIIGIQSLPARAKPNQTKNSNSCMLMFSIVSDFK